MIKAGNSRAITPRKGGPTPNKPSTARTPIARPVPTGNPSQTGSVLSGGSKPDSDGTQNKPKVAIPPPLPYMGG